MSADPYAPGAPPLWVSFPRALPAVVVGVLTALMTVLMFPPFHTPELAYAFAAPAILWAYRQPSWKWYGLTLLAAQAVAWIVVLCWLRHVTWVGLFILGPIVGVWVGVWYLAVRWVMPRLIGRSAPVRLLAQVGLAGLWVVIEWTRTWLITGFPWLPLAASQWERTSVLQIAAYTGAGGVSFVLIVANIGFAAYAHRLFFEGRSGFNRRSQEFMLALFLLLGCLCTMLTQSMNRAAFAQRLARVGFVQPDIPQSAKWDESEAPRIIRVLRELSVHAGKLGPDFLLWPESSLPFPVAVPVSAGATRIGQLIASTIDNQVKAPILLGAAAVDPKGQWFDAACLVTPRAGLAGSYYAKRHLVPFGEYIPWRWLFGWLSKVVPIGDDFTPGPPLPLPVNVPRQLGGGSLAVGPLVCYEDVFPDLARRSVELGAETLVVLTNDAWYGEEGAAYQHAAHSVLRAIETRRPVLRCGNAGWSGWIDEYGSFGVEDPARGRTSNVLLKDGSIYYRGIRLLDVLRDRRWIGRQSFYVRHGDWFVFVSAALALLAYWPLAWSNDGRIPRARRTGIKAG